MNEAVPAKLSRARLQLMLGHPFLSAAVARYPLVDASDMDWCRTLATDGYYIYYDPSFCESLTEPEMMAVLAHEVMHCVLGHIDRRGERDRMMWNIAIDHATNLFLDAGGFELPDNALKDHKFVGKTAEDIYDQLQDDPALRRRCLRWAPSGESTDEQGGTSADRLYSHEGGDAHVDPGDPYGAAKRQDEFPTEIERRRIRVSLSKEMKNQLPGRLAGRMGQEITKANTAHISWQSILARFFNGLRRNDYRLFPPNRKHTWRGIYLPSIGVPGPDHIVVAVDTSGSMGQDDLAMVLAELDQLRSMTECKLTIIECDADIQHTERFEPWEAANVSFEQRTFRGRGGTSLVPPFEWVEKELLGKAEPPDALFYVTDGYGDFPAKAPPYPLYWIATKHSIDKFPFGQVLKLTD